MAKTDAVNERMRFVMSLEKDACSVAEACREAEHAWNDAGIAVASDTLMQAVDALDALTGADGRDDVLGALFARFCIGK